METEPERRDTAIAKTLSVIVQKCGRSAIFFPSSSEFSGFGSCSSMRRIIRLPLQDLPDLV